ncbi:winged helix-turn-helix domain-containing protein [candidate division KSB1 bacterium]|nr:winged helix-turn-helix domain-containing protein [candidate division KSB1 bacterium]
MISDIGKTAGNIWQALKKNGDMSMTKLKSSVEKNPFLLNAAIGWLAREDNIEIKKQGNSIIITLKTE